MFLYVCMCVCIYVCMYACKYVMGGASLCSCTCICIYVCIYVSKCVCMYVCMYVCMCVCHGSGEPILTYGTCMYARATHTFQFYIYDELLQLIMHMCIMMRISMHMYVNEYAVHRMICVALDTSHTNTHTYTKATS